MSKMAILDAGQKAESWSGSEAPFRQPEWSALALMEGPERVVEAHLNFVNAGAELITTNSYACVPFHIGQERCSSPLAVVHTRGHAYGRICSRSLGRDNFGRRQCDDRSG
jgi:S-methylmethionine-dependent homocysteine/selenocysteine methylase